MVHQDATEFLATYMPTCLASHCWRSLCFWVHRMWASGGGTVTHCGICSWPWLCCML